MRDSHRSHADRERLFNANTRLAYAVLNAWTRRNTDVMARFGLERDDLESVALLALWTATGVWESSRGALSNLATREVQHALQKYATDAGRLKRGGAVAPAVRLDAPVAGSETGLLLDTLTHPDETPERTAIRRDGSTRLWQAVDGLPDRPRDVLTLHFVHDLPFAEIGERLGVSRQRVQQILARGLVALRSGAVGYGLFL